MVRHRDARRTRAGHGGNGQRSFGVDALSAGRPKPHLVQLLDYDRPQGGSFIPLIRGVLGDAMERGWGASVLLFESARSCAWVADLTSLGCEVKFASEELRSSDRALSQWVERSIPAEGKVILHTHFTGFDVAGALVKRRRRETTLLWHIHGVPPSDLRWRVRMRLKFGILGRLVDAFLCPADNIVDAVRSHGAPRPRVHFVPSAIDVERFPIATQEERLEARRELGLPLDGVHLLHFGWHWYLKGGDIFLEALKIVLASEDEVVAIERGGGDEYVEYARKLGIEDKVVVTEAVDDVELLHSAADVLVCSSREEGMAYALLESICSGTPVVATEIPGHAFVGREIRACEITGHAPAEIAAGISRVIARSPEEAAEVAQEGHHWMADNLSIPQVAASMVDRYDELVSASP